MSSGTKFESYGAKRVQNGLAPEVMARIARLGMSPRQQELNRAWASYRGQQYDARRVDWDGSERVEHIDSEAIATAGFIPPGFYDAGAQFPLKFRRPSAPYHLRRVIVDRFTGLLFSQRRNPSIRIAGDAASEDYVRTLAEVSRLWPAMIQARTYGGAMGTVVMGFQFLDGKPVVEVHDPRWCYPEFADRHALKLESLEKRYMYPVDERDPETGAWVQRPYWYRRVVNEEKDILYKSIPVNEGDEPEWEVQREVVHGFGFCPMIWVQNLPVQDDIDGDPDCAGIDDLCIQIDALLSQANQGILANCDPTLRIISDADLDGIRKGSKNAIKLPQGSSIDYMELSGSGPKAAIDMADRLRTLALEVAQCVLDHPEVASRTATEVERTYASMLSKADILREQYGERGIKPLLEMMVKATQKLAKPRQTENGIVRQAVLLPPRVETLEDGTINRVQREMGPGGELTLLWGPYFQPTLDDAKNAATAAVAAKAGGVIDSATAISFSAPFFGVEDIAALVRKIKEEQAQSQADTGMFGEAPAPESDYSDATDEQYQDEQTEEPAPNQPPEEGEE